ncbi:MAG: ABC transporter permease [bacterium]|nr:ABC transporter permease [bacterium]
MKQSPSPPKLADRFFRWYCNDRLSETILGDLHENYVARYKEKGRFKSNVHYWLDVIRFINRFTLSRNQNTATQSNNLAMIRNYLLVTLRGLWNNKAYATINTLGLAFGLASFMVIFFFVKNELSVDQFHTKHDRIYRVTNTFERSSGNIFWARTPPALAPGIRSNIAGIEKVTRLRYADDHTYAVGDRIFNQGNVFYADSSFLEIFDFELKYGNKATALSSPNSLVMTEEMALKYFGKDNPMGKTVTLDNNKSLLVTGVLHSIPGNSHITFDMLMSFETFVVPDGYLADLNSWSWAGFHTYALVSSQTDVANINEQIVKLYKENFNRANISVKAELQPLSSIYLGSNHFTNVGECIRSGNKSTIYSLMIIAILILVMAGFNFTNLSTALSLGRGKEIGLRKTMGAARSRIFTQFLVESQVVSTISLVIAICIVLALQPYLERQLSLTLPDIESFLYLIPIFGLISLIIGILSGLYPSVILSGFSPIVALKGNLKTGRTGLLLRNSLTVFQFVISVVLIAGSFLILSQIKFIQNKDLGFEKENILQIKVLREDMGRYYNALKDRFLQNPQVNHVSMSSHSFDGGSSSGPARLSGAPEDEAFQLAYYQTDHDFLDLTNIQLVEGRYFSKDFVTDSSAIILNETAVELMELNSPIGTKLNFTGQERKVIGVVRDFHFNSLHAKISPMAIVMPFTTTELMLVKVAPGDLPETLRILEKNWHSVVESSPFEVSFLNDGIQNLYIQEEKLSKLTNLFSGLAMILACMGLYGLVAFSIQAKTKEVGIRKVLGASSMEILLVLSKKFLALILIANLIAWPLIYFLGQLWLENFSYRIDMPWWISITAGLTLLLVAIATISHQTLKAANTNPANVLRTE